MTCTAFVSNWDRNERRIFLFSPGCHWNLTFRGPGLDYFPLEGAELFGEFHAGYQILRVTQQKGQRTFSSQQTACFQIGIGMSLEDPSSPRCQTCCFWGPGLEGTPLCVPCEAAGSIVGKWGLGHVLPLELNGNPGD